MDLTHRFSVPAGLDDAWRAFNDLEGLAPCFPGATVSNVEGDEFAGSVKVRLGPIALLYTGSGRYLERNLAERRVVIEARGNDKRGNGTATATVTASFTENGDQTDVEVVTDLVITGKPAQFGRGVISDVSDTLLSQFLGCVSERFAAGLGGTQSSADGPAAPAGTDLDAPAPAAGTTPIDVPDGPAGASAPWSPDPDRPHPGAPDRASTEPEGLNVLGTLVPVLVKRYGPAVASIAVLLFVVITIVRRRR